MEFYNIHLVAVKQASRKLFWLCAMCICQLPVSSHPQFGFGRNDVRSAPSAIVVRQLLPGQELIFSNSESPNSVESLTERPNVSGIYPVFVNNVPVYPTLTPFLPQTTTPSPQFLECIQRCPTTSEYNPVCANNRQMYGNAQKFNCARRCGANIEIVRRGTCMDLLRSQMTNT
ncbi:uncharacterized protein [Musca autumnalis]|uniref:uncharacterized protein n=1 Tax=Musca autumnalis TaxID=221902 RepID=UPI003CE8CDA5